MHENERLWELLNTIIAQSAAHNEIEALSYIG